MNERIQALAAKAGIFYYRKGQLQGDIERYTKLVVEETLTQVKERAYYTGDRDWSDEVDRPWIQLEFGYGSLADAQKGVFK
jgi:hypothetical protein